MAKSYQTFTAAGNATTYVLADIQAQGYINLADLKVYVNGTNITTGYSIATSPSLALVFQAGSIPANGSIIKVQRETNSNASGRAVDFDNGSVLTAEDLDKSSLQLLYIAQETQEGVGETIEKGFDGQWDAESLKVRNVVDPIAPQDVATKNYVDGAIGLSGEGTIAVPQNWTFNGTGSQTLFQLIPQANATEPNLFIVEVGGVIQRPGDAYSIPNPGQLQLTAAPGNGVVITVRNFGVSRSVAEWDGNVTFSGNSTFAGTSTFNSPVTMTSTLAVTGDLSVDTNVLKVDTATNRVGINKTPTTALDVSGTVTSTAVTSGTGSFSNITCADLTTVLTGSLANSMLVADNTGVTVNGPLTVTGTITGTVSSTAQWVRVVASSSAGVVTQANLTLVNFATRAGSMQSSFNLTNDTFTAPYTGAYIFTGTLNFGTPAVENAIEIAAFSGVTVVNSSLVSRWTDGGNHSITCVFNLSQGQTVGMYFKGTYSTGTTTGMGGTTVVNNSLSIAYLGA